MNRAKISARLSRYERDEDEEEDPPRKRDVDRCRAVTWTHERDRPKEFDCGARGQCEEDE
jgi:hypothetical protein